MDEIIQGSPEWYAIRCGKVTASRLGDVMARIKTGWGAMRANYHAELVAERLTGECARGYVSPEMQWGSDHEAEARAAYEFIADATVEQIGFAVHPSIPDSGASPDGLAGADGLVEIKCPNTATHIDTLLAGVVPNKHLVQIQWQLACTGRQWCDFVSFDPRLPMDLQTFIRRVHRDSAKIAELETEVAVFLGEVASTVARLQNLTRAAA